MSYAPAQKTNTFALVGMIVGIVGLLGVVLCCCFPFFTAVWFGLFGIPAIILGYLGRQQIRASDGAESGEQMALVALVLGGIETAIAILGVCLLIMAAVGAVTLPVLDTISTSLS